MTDSRRRWSDRTRHIEVVRALHKFRRVGGAVGKFALEFHAADLFYRIAQGVDGLAIGIVIDRNKAMNQVKFQRAGLAVIRQLLGQALQPLGDFGVQKGWRRPRVAAQFGVVGQGVDLLATVDDGDGVHERAEGGILRGVVEEMTFLGDKVRQFLDRVDAEVRPRTVGGLAAADDLVVV